MSEEMQTCLEENGVEPPTTGGEMSEGGAGGGRPPTDGTSPPSGEMGSAGDASTAPPGVDSATWAAAQEACSALATTGS